MTREEANKKAWEIIRESNEESDRVMEAAKKNGTWKMGLDSNKELFKEINQKYFQMLQELAAQIDEE